MKINYSIGDSPKETSLTNDDVIIAGQSDGHHRKVSITAQKDIVLKDCYFEFVFKADKKGEIFLNGYQSWTDSKEANLSKKEKNVNKLPKAILNGFNLIGYGDNTFYRYDKKHVHGYDVCYFKGDKEWFVYSLNYKTAYLIIEIERQSGEVTLISQTEGISLKQGESVTVLDIKTYDSVEKGTASFRKDYKVENKHKQFGYSSWYNYYQDINEKIILRDLDSLDNRFELFQIDDGFEEYVGDWLEVDKKKFPNGLKEIVEKTHAKKMKAGIWLSPFIAEEKSKLLKEHPDFIKKDPNGNAVKCGGNWSGQYPLDLSKKEVWDYIEKCLKAYVDLGFDFFKLDFLYASSIQPYEGKSRAQMAYESYHKLREILNGKIILGCGASLFSSYQNFDYVRVGPDISLKFDDNWYMKYMHRERISTKITLQNTIYRSFFNNALFGNDPDVFLLRDDNIHLNDKQKEAIIVIDALFGNSLLTSDDISNYSETKRGLLEEAFEISEHATKKSFKKNKNNIEIYYSMNKKDYHLTYSTKKGVFTYGR